MRNALWVLCFFAAIWAVAGVLVDGAPTWWIGPPIVLSAAILIFALRRAGGRQESAPHVGRLIGIWSAVEGVAMFVAANVLVNLHLRQAIMPVFAIIVGLHFLPLARGIPARLYYATGAGLIVVGIAALMAPPWHLPLLVGGAAAAILWASAAASVLGAR